MADDFPVEMLALVSESLRAAGCTLTDSGPNSNGFCVDDVTIECTRDTILSSRRIAIQGLDAAKLFARLIDPRDRQAGLAGPAEQLRERPDPRIAKDVRQRLSQGAIDPALAEATRRLHLDAYSMILQLEGRCEKLAEQLYDARRAVEITEAKDDVRAVQHALEEQASRRAQYGADLGSVPATEPNCGDDPARWARLFRHRMKTGAVLLAENSLREWFEGMIESAIAARRERQLHEFEQRFANAGLTEEQVRSMQPKRPVQPKKPMLTFSLPARAIGAIVNGVYYPADGQVAARAGVTVVEPVTPTAISVDPAKGSDQTQLFAVDVAGNILLCEAP